MQRGFASFFLCGQTFGRKWPIFRVIRMCPECSNTSESLWLVPLHGRKMPGTNGNSSCIFSAEKCTVIIRYAKVWKWCRTFSANYFDLNVRHLTCLRSFCVEHSGQLPAGTMRIWLVISSAGGIRFRKWCSRYYSETKKSLCY